MTPLAIQPRHACGLPRLPVRPTRVSARFPGLSPARTPALSPRRRSLAPRAAAPASVSVSENLLRVATGVPLEAAFEQLPLAQAALSSVALITLASVVTNLLQRLIRWVGRRVDARMEAEVALPQARRPGALRTLVYAAVVAVQRPANALLPWSCFAFCSTVGAAFAEVLALEVRAGVTHMSRSAVMKSCTGGAMRGLRELAQFMQDTSEFTLIIFFAWFLVAWKNRVVQEVVERAQADNASDGASLARIISPASNLASWGLIASAVLASLHVYGLNIQPLLALGSVSTLAVGFAAQSTVTNVVSAFSLHAARPFIAGDRVSLKALNGGAIAAGTVLRISPMYTTLQTDANVPMFIHNKDLATSMLIVNESKPLPPLAPAPPPPPPPCIDVAVTLRYEDAHRVPEIEASVNTWLASNPAFVPGPNCYCALDRFAPEGAILVVKAQLTTDGLARRAALQSQVLCAVESAVRRASASLAVKS